MRTLGRGVVVLLGGLGLLWVAAGSYWLGVWMLASGSQP